MNELEEKIVVGMARALFVQAWADEQERQGSRQPMGADWMDLAPITPHYALLEGARLAGMIEQLNGGSLTILLHKAARADAEDKCGEGNLRGKARRLREDELSDEMLADPEYARLFGHYLAMQSLGHGVGWFDDHATFALNLPNVEFELREGAELLNPDVNDIVLGAAAGHLGVSTPPAGEARKMRADRDGFVLAFIDHRRNEHGALDGPVPTRDRALQWNRDDFESAHREPSAKSLDVAIIRVDRDGHHHVDHIWDYIRNAWRKA